MLQYPRVAGRLCWGFCSGYGRAPFGVDLRKRSALLHILEKGTTVVNIDVGDAHQILLFSTREDWWKQHASMWAAI